MAHVSKQHSIPIWHMFQKGTQCQPETCFRLAHVSELHTIPVLNMFQNGTCFQTARSINLTHVWAWHLFQNVCIFLWTETTQVFKHALSVLSHPKWDKVWRHWIWAADMRSSFNINSMYGASSFCFRNIYSCLCESYF